MNLKQVALCTMALTVMVGAVSAELRTPPPNGETGTLEFRYTGSDCLNEQTCGPYQVEVWGTAKDPGGQGVGIAGAQFLIQWDAGCVDESMFNYGIDIQPAPGFTAVNPSVDPVQFPDYEQYRSGELDYGVLADNILDLPVGEVHLATITVYPDCTNESCTPCLLFREEGLGGELLNKVGVLGGAIEYDPDEPVNPLELLSTTECTGPTIDTQKPWIECPEDLYLQVDCMGTDCGVVVDIGDLEPLDWGDNVTAKADMTPTPYGIPAGNLFPVGETMVCWTVVDECGNEEQCCFYVYVDPVEPPSFECIDDVQLYTDPDTCGATWEGLQDVIDSLIVCGDPADLVCTRTEPDGSTGDCFSTQFDLGCTLIELSIVDICDQQAQCIFEVCVDDGQNPDITCPPDVTVTADPGECSAVIDEAIIGEATCVDNCFDTDVYYWRSDDHTAKLTDPFPIGETVINWVCCDGELYDSCQQTITVTDDEPPVITCNDITTNADEEVCEATLDVRVDVTDNCPLECEEASVTYWIGTEEILDPSAHTFPLGETEVCVRATDCHGNEALECCFTVKVEDEVPPDWTYCPKFIDVTTDPGVCTARVVLDATAEDNCEDCEVTITYFVDGLEIPAEYDFELGCTMVTAKAVDCVGNEAHPCTFKVCVTDDEQPTLACPDDVTTNSAPGECGREMSFEAVIQDNCPLTCTPDPVLYYVGGNEISFPYYFPVGTTEVLAIGTDCSQNQIQCTFDVTVEDVEPPMIECPADVTTNAFLDYCSRYMMFDIPISDNCYEECQGLEVMFTLNGEPVSPNPPKTHIPIPGVIQFAYDFPVGTSTVCVKAMDCHGNDYECCFDVTIVDNQPPVLVDLQEELKWFAKLGEDHAWIPVEPACVDVNCKNSQDKIYMPRCIDNCDPCHECSPMALMCDGQPPVWKEEGGNLYWKFPIGWTRITWICTDDAGNISSPQYQDVYIHHGFMAKVEMDTYDVPGGLDFLLDPGLNPGEHSGYEQYGVPYGKAYQAPIRFEIGEGGGSERLSVVADLAFDRMDSFAVYPLCPGEIAMDTYGTSTKDYVWVEVPFIQGETCPWDTPCDELAYFGCGENDPIEFGAEVNFAAKHDTWGLWRIVPDIPVAEAGPDPGLNTTKVEFIRAGVDDDKTLTLGNFKPSESFDADNIIDVTDFTIMALNFDWQLNQPDFTFGIWGPAHSECSWWDCPAWDDPQITLICGPLRSTPLPNTDLNGDWYVDNGLSVGPYDILIFGSRIWRTGEATWWNGGEKAVAETPRRSIHVKELRAMGIRHAAEVDYDRDGWITENDIEIFFDKVNGQGDGSNGWQNTRPSKKTDK